MDDRLERRGRIDHGKAIRAHSGLREITASGTLEERQLFFLEAIQSFTARCDALEPELWVQIQDDGHVRLQSLYGQLVQLVDQIQ